MCQPRCQSDGSDGTQFARAADLDWRNSKPFETALHDGNSTKATHLNVGKEEMLALNVEKRRGVGSAFRGIRLEIADGRTRTISQVTRRSAWARSNLEVIGGSVSQERRRQQDGRRASERRSRDDGQGLTCSRAQGIVQNT